MPSGRHRGRDAERRQLLPAASNERRHPPRGAVGVERQEVVPQRGGRIASATGTAESPAAARARARRRDSRGRATRDAFLRPAPCPAGSHRRASRRCRTRAPTSRAPSSLCSPLQCLPPTFDGRMSGSDRSRSNAMTLAGARFRKSNSIECATRGHGHRPTIGARSCSVVSLISTRTMSGLTLAGEAARSMRQSYVVSSARSSSPAERTPSATTAAATPMRTPAISLRTIH